MPGYNRERLPSSFIDIVVPEDYELALTMLAPLARL